jgi:hypothetical protein
MRKTLRVSNVSAIGLTGKNPAVRIVWISGLFRWAGSGFGIQVVWVACVESAVLASRGQSLAVLS